MSPSTGRTYNSAASMRIAKYMERTTGISEFERDHIIPALAIRAYHLPGNNWWEDIIQYNCNNHPLFGICCHHRLHPVKTGMRLINLFGSTMFGLLVTNILWLWFIHDEGSGEDTLITISLNPGNLTNSNTTLAQSASEQVDITEGMVILWTVGGGLHAIYDLTVWYLTACVCCLPGRSWEHLGRYKWCGTYLIVFTVVIITALTTLTVVVRASIGDDVKFQDLESAGLVDDKVDYSHEWAAYKFLISYCIELVLALFVYYPLVAVVLVSGILGCGKIPILGGRPYEIAQEMREEQRRDSSKHQSSFGQA